MHHTWTVECRSCPTAVQLLGRVQVWGLWESLLLWSGEYEPTKGRNTCYSRDVLMILFHQTFLFTSCFSE